MDRLDIYPFAGRWSEVGPKSGEFDYFLDAFDAIRSLVRRGAKARLGMIAWLS